jgi:hypothetical protein
MHLIFEWHDDMKWVTQIDKGKPGTVAEFNNDKPGT